MSLNRLTIFATVAKHLNFTRASEELHISQPSISQHVKQLQEEYRTVFYKRCARGIELTEAGRALLGKIRPILSQIEKLNSSFDHSPRTIRSETFTVAGSHSFSAALLPSLLAALNRNHTRIPITLRTDNSDAVEQMVLKAQADIGLVSRPPKSPNIFGEPFRKKIMVPFVAVSHPIARRSKLTLSDLSETPLIIRGNGIGKTTAEEIFEQLENRGIKLNIVMRCESPQAVKAAVRNKIGVGIVFREIIDPDIRDGYFKIVKIPGLKLETTSFIIRHRDRPLPTNALHFLRLLRQFRDKKEKNNGFRDS